MATAILPASGISASHPVPINRPVEDVREISLSLIDPPAWNPRRNFDQAELKKLAESLSQDKVGMLQPILVRPAKGKRFQVVAGERRYRAACQAEIKTVRCTVRRCSDREAAELQLVENAQRADLDPIEVSVGFRALMELGHTAASLAELAGTEERVVSDRLALLTLPDAWQTRIRQGKISAAQAEYLLPFANRPKVLDALAGVPASELPLCEWKHRILSAAMAVSRSMDPDAPDGPQFELGDDNVRRLDVVTLEIQPGRTVKRSFAAAIWDVLQDDAGRREEPGLQRTNGAGRATNGKRVGLRPADAAFGEPVLLGAEADGADFNRRLQEWLANYLRQLCTDAIAAAAPHRLPSLAAALGVDIDASWRLRRDFLELFAGERLEALAANLGVRVETCRNDDERVAVLLATSPKAVPTILREAINAAGEPAA